MTESSPGRDGAVVWGTRVPPPLLPASLPWDRSHSTGGSVLCVLIAEHAQEDRPPLPISTRPTFPFPAYRVFLKKVSQNCKPEQPVTCLATDGAQESHYLSPDKEPCEATAGAFQYPLSDASFCLVPTGSNPFSHTLPIKWKQ